jgi:cation diffusion facilitator family transporter
MLKGNEDITTEEVRSRERIVFWSVVATALSLIPTAYAAFISNSTTLLADLLRCVAEFVAILLSWFVLRQLSRHDPAAYNYGLGKLEQLASLAVATALFVSFLLAFGSGLARFWSPQALESTTFGFIFAILGTIGNAFLWLKDYRYYLASPSPVMESQWKLFRAKTCATTVVTLSLGLSMIFSESSVSNYFDPLGSLILSLFLLYSSYSMVSTSMPDLIDRSVDEKVQIIIHTTLTGHLDRYVALERIRTRRSGAQMFIDIFLSFDGQAPFHRVHECVMSIKSELRDRLGKAEVIVIPSLKD